MNKKSLSEIRKNLKAGNTMLKIKDIYNVYVKKDNAAVIHKELNNFERLDSEQKELYFKNFKKILTGELDVKLFELEFLNFTGGNNVQKAFYSVVDENEDSETFINIADKIVSRTIKETNYDTDIVLSFARMEYWKGAKKKKEESDESEDDAVYPFNFMMCTINGVKTPKKALEFDFKEKEFKINSVLDLTINLESPLNGFMYPCFNNNAADANKVMFFNSKTKEINTDLIKNVLECSFRKTALEEKNEFLTVINMAVNGQITPYEIESIYEKIKEKMDVEDDESVKMDAGDIEEILEDCGITAEDDIAEIIEKVTGDAGSEFKIQNIIPDMDSKSVKINTDNITITIKPSELNKIKKVINEDGISCLIIKLDEDINLEGFNINTEKI